LQKLFSKSKDFAGTIFLINGFSHHVLRVQIITKVGSETKTKPRHGPKTIIFFTGTKTKTKHICRNQNHILAIN